MLPLGRTPSVKARRNLILLTKLLQNIANNIEFGVKGMAGGGKAYPATV